MAIMFCGVDPGAKGAGAFIDMNGVVSIFDYGKGDCYSFLAGTKGLGYEIRAVIEKQAPRPGNAAGATYQMGRNYQDWVAWFKILKIPFDEEIPTTWQKQVFDPGTRPKRGKAERPEGMDDVDFVKWKAKRGREHKKKLKLASIERAKRLYPAAASLITRDDRAEALLIAHFCWLRYH